MKVRRNQRAMAALGAAAVTFGGALTAQDRAAAVPGAPSGLTYQVNGRTVTLNWNNSTGVFSFYRLEAGGSPGTTFFTFDTNVLVDPTKLPQLLAAFGTGGVGNGNYYVRIRGANAEGFSTPSNEVIVPVTGACQAPGAPTDFTAIIRGSFGYLQWNPGNGGQPTSYTLVASYTPGGAPIAAFPASTPHMNVGGIPTGTYYVYVTATTACGTSPSSNVITVVAPSNTPATTPAAATGRLPQPHVRDAVLQYAAEARSRGLMDGAVSCPSRPGFPDSDIEARKTNLNGYISFIVDRLRQNVDGRFGYNAKPTRANAIVAGDEIAYHWGSDAPEGSPNVYLVDTLGGHCTFGNETADYRVFYNEFGRWTGAGRF
jgi:hypothetical protein